MPISASGYGSGYALPTTAGNVAPLGYQQLVLEGGDTLVLTVPAGARLALIQIEEANARWRDDGMEPTDSEGMLLAAGDSMIYDGDLAALCLIQVDMDAVVNVAYYR